MTEKTNRKVKTLFSHIKYQTLAIVSFADHVQYSFPCWQSYRKKYKEINLVTSAQIV